MKMEWLTGAVLAIVMIAGCGSSNNNEPVSDNDNAAADQVEYGLIGEVIDVIREKSNGRLGSVHVSGEAEDAMYSEGMVTVTTETAFISEQGLEFDDIEEGMEVWVLFDGEVMESHPVQGIAGQIEIKTRE